MSREREKLTGIYPATITPFTGEGKINEGAMKELISRNIGEGAKGVFIGGSSAECFLLTPEERKRIFEIASDFKGRTTLIAHVGAISTGQAVGYALYAKELGFDMIAATPPFYYGFDSRSVAGYYYDIYEASGMPVLIYNFPGNTGREFNLSDPVYQELFKSPAILGVKHTNQVVYQLERIKHLNPNLIVFNGFDETMVAGLALGADGSVGSTFNFMLPHYKKIFDSYKKKEWEQALELQIKANNIMNALCDVGLIPAIKYVLTTQGIDAGDPRKPFYPLTPDARAYVDRAVKENLVTE